MGEGIEAKVRLIDCVGYMVEGAGGHMENGEERMVKAGDVVHVRREQFHAIRAITDLYIIEVQSGERLTEDDITRYPYNWE